jgi:hypothetical protein
MDYSLNPVIFQCTDLKIIANNINSKTTTKSLKTSVQKLPGWNVKLEQKN